MTQACGCPKGIMVPMVSHPRKANLVDPDEGNEKQEIKEARILRTRDSDQIQTQYVMADYMLILLFQF